MERKMRLKPFEPADAERLAAISRRAFENDVRYGAPAEGGPPGYDSAAWQQETARAATAYLEIEIEGTIVGGIIVFGTSGEYVVGRMFIEPDQQNRGIGAKAMDLLERRFPDAKRWSLETPPWNRRNHRFYGKVGYARAGRSASGDYLFEKHMTGSRST
jgi:GNAT superfamily N-acetyltransferase